LRAEKRAEQIAKAILERFYTLGQTMPETNKTKYSVGNGISIGVNGHHVRRRQRALHGARGH
jgi:Cu2+-exporting ATPase